MKINLSKADYIETANYFNTKKLSAWKTKELVEILDAVVRHSYDYKTEVLHTILTTEITSRKSTYLAWQANLISAVALILSILAFYKAT